MSCPFVYINGTLSLVLKGKTYQINSDHPSYGIIKKSLQTASEDALLKMIDVQSSMKYYVENASQGKATVDNGIVYFNNKPIHNTLANRILEFMKEGLPFIHLLRFMENLALNPSYNSQQQLFDFLENKNLPITEDGCILCYKAVRQDWMDKYSGTIDNSIGNIIEVNRNSVDDERTNECSHGLHCGALPYVYSYGKDNDHIIIVKIHPKDVVSVPKDCSFQKLRCCKYEVIHEFHGEMNSPLYTDRAERVSSPIDDDKYDWGWADKHNNDGYYDDDNYNEYEEDDYDYDDDSDLDDYDDDYLSVKDVCVTKSKKCSTYDLGSKSNGQNYYNRRDKNGRFCK